MRVLGGVLIFVGLCLLVPVVLFTGWAVYVFCVLPLISEGRISDGEGVFALLIQTIQTFWKLEAPAVLLIVTGIIIRRQGVKAGVH